MNFLISNDLLSPLVTGLFTLVSALVPSLVIYLLSKRYLSTKQTDQTCLHALEELEYTKAVLSKLDEKNGVSSRKASEEVRKELGLTSNGLFTPSKLSKKLRTYRRKVDSSLPVV